MGGHSGRGLSEGGWEGSGHGHSGRGVIWLDPPPTYTLSPNQLLMTMLMTTVVIYIYTVVAFNFFRKFYPKEAAIVEGVELHSCSSMVRVSTQFVCC